MRTRRVKKKDLNCNVHKKDIVQSCSISFCSCEHQLVVASASMVRKAATVYFQQQANTRL